MKFTSSLVKKIINGNWRLQKKITSGRPKSGAKKCDSVTVGGNDSDWCHQARNWSVKRNFGGRKKKSSDG